MSAAYERTERTELTPLERQVSVRNLERVAPYIKDCTRLCGLSSAVAALCQVATGYISDRLSRATVSLSSTIFVPLLPYIYIY